MFRLKHFVILFAVFLCAYAAPADPKSAAASPKQATPDAKGKDDLATAATTYLRYIDNGQYIPGLDELNAYPLYPNSRIITSFDEFGRQVLNPNFPYFDELLGLPTVPRVVNSNFRTLIL